MRKRNCSDTFSLDRRIAAALAEDVGPGDLTSLSIFSPSHRSRARLTAKQPGIAAGLDAARRVCRRVDPELLWVAKVKDGDRLRAGQVMLLLSGRTLSILRAERLMLNFLQRLSGVATLTSRFVRAVRGTRARILDTRKTTPLWRDLEKRAVLSGGGHNHRRGLYDAVLIKDNHIAAAGGIAAAVQRVRNSLGRRRVLIEVETSNLEQFREACRTGVDRVMLDNMRPAEMKKAVSWLRAQKPPRPEVEASGGVTVQNVRRVARTGVDYISVGALTHSAPALDISLLIE